MHFFAFNSLNERPRYLQQRGLEYVGSRSVEDLHESDGHEGIMRIPFDTSSSSSTLTTQMGSYSVFSPWKASMVTNPLPAMASHFWSTPPPLTRSPAVPKMSHVTDEIGCKLVTTLGGKHVGDGAVSGYPYWITSMGRRAPEGRRCAMRRE
jgi:hypothetical protein